MLVDPELARRARELLREPNEANGKGEHMSALGTHEITSARGLGFEPPLSPPVVRGPSASMAMPSNDSLSELPTPPPAIRPPESASLASAPEPPLEPAPQAAVPEQPEPPVTPESDLVQPERAPEPELPTMAPPAQPAEPVLDYFSAPALSTETEALPEAAPAEEPAEPVQLPAIQSLPLVTPAPTPPEEAEPAPELPTMAPPEPEIELPAAFIAPQPVETEPEPVEAAPAPTTAEPMDVSVPVVEPLLPPDPVPAPELEQLLGPTRTEFRVVVRLKEGEGVEVGSFRDFGTAMEGAQEVIEQVSTATEGRWPFYAGRFIRPDLIVSVDVVEGEDR
jgi:hypothetical protein